MKRLLTDSMLGCLATHLRMCGDDTVKRVASDARTPECAPDAHSVDVWRCGQHVWKSHWASVAETFGSVRGNP